MLRSREDLMGIQQKPDFLMIHRVSKAIPQYMIGHESRVQELVTFEANNPGLYIRGNFIGGIAIGDVIKESQSTAWQIKNYLNL